MRRSHRRLIAGGFGLLLAIGAVADQDDDTVALIKTLMGAEQYRAAGLDKLSTAEREALYQWLLTFQGSAATQVASAVEKIVPTSTATAAATTSVPGMPDTAARPQVREAAVQTTATAPSPTGGGTQPGEKAIEENFGLPDPVDTAKAAYQLHATIREPFRGWSGDTVFYLDNGQIWKQRTKGRHVYTGDDNRVVISQNVLGFYEMRLIAADRSVGVKRIK